MGILLAMTAAVLYGMSDFAGGVLTRRTHVLVVLLVSQLVSSVLLLAVVALWANAISWSGVGWGTAAGVAGVAGTSLLYQGLAIGRMSAVAPITAILGAGLPVLFGLATGERPEPAALTGVVMGLIAVIVITRTPDPSEAKTAANPGDDLAVRLASRSRQAIVYAFGAGVGFGLFYVLLEHSPVDSGLWPLLGTRISLVSLLGLAVARRRLAMRIAAGIGLGLVCLGIVNTMADLTFLLAVRVESLSLVAVITSMYPAATVALAGLFLGERIASPQVIGLVIAAISVALIALG